MQSKFKENRGKITIYNTPFYAESIDERIFNKIKNPAIAINLILERRFSQAYQNGDLTLKEYKRINQLLNNEMRKDIRNLPIKTQKRIQRMKRKLRKGERVIHFPNLSKFFFK